MVRKFSDFEKMKINEDVFIDVDSGGWNTEELESVGLIDLLKKIENLKYEISTSVRGTGGVSGDTTDDLISDLERLGNELIDMAGEIANY